MKQFSRRAFAILAVAASVAAGPVFAQAKMDHGSGMMDHSKMGDMKGGGLASLDAVDGEVRRVDKAAGKVTLRHGEIKQLDMPPMTMVFEVKDKALLDNVKPGDKVKFKVIDDHGKMIVTELKPAG
jgi:Cu/Ag efflux protein CusF